MEKKNPIEEARRYVENAKALIVTADGDPTGKFLTDGKYVKMAGNTLWNGCLVAIEATFKLKSGKGRPSIEKYRDAIGKRDGQMLTLVNTGYNIMHLSMGYDGIKSKKVVAEGFDTAASIINRCARMIGNQ